MHVVGAALQFVFIWCGSMDRREGLTRLVLTQSTEKAGSTRFEYLFIVLIFSGIVIQITKGVQNIRGMHVFWVYHGFWLLIPIPPLIAAHEKKLEKRLIIISVRFQSIQRSHLKRAARAAVPHAQRLYCRRLSPYPGGELYAVLL